MLRVKDLHFSYKTDAPLLKGINLEHQEGRLISLLGPSGCGKSTLLRLVAGLEIGQGEVVWTEPQTASFVFQDAALLPWSTVSENICLPQRLEKTSASPLSFGQLLEKVGLVGFEDRYPKTLSGGQKMRVSIARAIASGASYLLMDEPFAALDEILRFKMNDLLLSLKNEQGLSILFVTHSIYEAAYISDQVLVMKEGQVSADIQVKLDRRVSPEEQRASGAFLGAVAQISEALKR